MKYSDECYKCFSHILRSILHTSTKQIAHIAKHITLDKLQSHFTPSHTHEPRLSVKLHDMFMISVDGTNTDANSIGET